MTTSVPAVGGHPRLRLRSRLDEMRTPLVPAATALVGVSALTLVVSLDRRLRFAYLNPEGRVAVETAVALLSLFVGVLALGRFRSSRSTGDLGVVIAVFILSFAGGAFSALPRSFGGSDPEAFATWTSLVARFVGAVVLAASPFLFSRRASHGTPRAVTVGLTVAMLSIGLLAGMLASRLPDGVRITLPIEASSRPRVEEATVVVIVQLVVAIMFAIAGFGFARRAVRAPDDVFVRWMAAGALLQSGARGHYALFPSVFSDWLYTGDVLRLLGTAAWLVGALAEITRYWHDREHLAVLQERRRMARELHDGLLQDLSFIHSQSTASVTPSAETMTHVAAAADRALRETRLAVEALTESTEMPPEVALRRAAEQIAVPAGLTVTCSFQPGCTVELPLRHDLARIVQEASSNAVKHARASSLAVELDSAADGSLWLMIADDGAGFDVDDAPGRGFGLTSMHERAREIGAELTITSVLGQGTVVEVMVPAHSAAVAT